MKSEIKKSAEEIACALAPIFIMAEIRFLSQYTAVSQERRPTILIQLGFYSLLLAVSDASSYFLFLTFVQLFGSKLKRTIFSVLVNFQDKNSRGIFWVLNAALQIKEWVNSQISPKIYTIQTT